MSTTLTRPRPSLRGPVRVVVRQHRWTLWAAAALMALVVVVLVVTRLLTDRSVDLFAATGCSTAKTLQGCDGTARSYLDDQHMLHAIQVYAGVVMLALPLLVGIFAAGPLIARELETGTYRLAWSQSVSPARWLAAKLAVPAVLLTAGVCVLSAAFTWARARTGGEYEDEWFDGPVFATMGAVPVGYVLLGLTAGTLTGLLIRRTVPAMAVGALAVGAVLVTLGSIRSSLWPLRTLTGTLHSAGDPWVLEVGQVTAGGQRLPVDTCWGPEMNKAEEARCVADHGITGPFFDYHPASHFWPLQLVETGLLLALAALALALAFRVLRRRTG
ncbi:ABC transporter permease [Streptomyces sp. NBC_01341]|uniref:hypothetical protein n=1 Tax=Streptomyces sp. NBC_01341 TaxID=2903831 RepID=UPI002E0E7232|nr:ABC transporter permease [Streptomyces sp. NBC_01341]